MRANTGFTQGEFVSPVSRYLGGVVLTGVTIPRWSCSHLLQETADGLHTAHLDHVLLVGRMIRYETPQQVKEPSNIVLCERNGSQTTPRSALSEVISTYH